MTERTAYPIKPDQRGMMREFLFNYRFGGHEWGITIYADSPDEAKEKIRAVALARYQGEMYMRIPASMLPFGLLPRVITWLRRRQWARRGEAMTERTANEPAQCECCQQKCRCGRWTACAPGCPFFPYRADDEQRVKP